MEEKRVNRRAAETPRKGLCDSRRGDGLNKQEALGEPDIYYAARENGMNAVLLFQFMQTAKTSGFVCALDSARNSLREGTNRKPTCMKPVANNEFRKDSCLSAHRANHTSSVSIKNK